MRITIAQVFEQGKEIKNTLQDHTRTDNENFKEIKTILLGDGKDQAGIITRLDRLEKSYAAVKRNAYAVWAAVAAAVVGYYMK